jgi:hypothetical protein
VGLGASAKTEARIPALVDDIEEGRGSLCFAKGLRKNKLVKFILPENGFRVIAGACTMQLL